MVTRDPETGEFMAGNDEMADYTSFDYQHFDFVYSDNGGSSAASAVTAGVDPLEDSGGLEINEVAELVAMRITVDISADNFEGKDNELAGSLQMRGVLGANVDSRDDLPGNTDQVAEIDQTNGIEEDATVLFEQDSPDIDLQFRSHDKEEVFYTFQVSNDPPFANSTNGLGGGGGFLSQRDTLNFRDLVGRGPVMDSNDEVSIVATLNKNQVAVQAEASIRATLIWDVAELDNAGRRFSVPSQD